MMKNPYIYALITDTKCTDQVKPHIVNYNILIEHEKIGFYNGLKMERFQRFTGVHLQPWT